MKKMKRWVVALISVILTAAILVAVGVGSYGFRNWHIKEWFNHWGKGDGTEQGETAPPAAIGGGMVLEEEDETASASPIRLTSYSLTPEEYAANGVEESAESAVTVTATVQPDNDAMNSVIVWRLEWKDGSSEWASGKAISDYMTATSDEDSITGSKTVTLSCLESFGEPIILTAKCKYDEAITASIQIDYAARLEFVEYVATNLTDALGENHSISWGGRTRIPFECGNPTKAINLFPTRISFRTDGDFTIGDSYTVALDHEFKKGQPEYVDSLVNGFMSNSYSYRFEKQTVNLGKIEISQTNKNLNLAPNLSEGENNAFLMSAYGIGHYMNGKYMGGGPSSSSNLYESCTINGLSFCNDANNRESNFSTDFSTITLRLENERDSCEFEITIQLTKAIYSVNITDITLDQGGIVF